MIKISGEWQYKQNPRQQFSLGKDCAEILYILSAIYNPEVEDIQCWQDLWG